MRKSTIEKSNIHYVTPYGFTMSFSCVSEPDKKERKKESFRRLSFRAFTLNSVTSNEQVSVSAPSCAHGLCMLIPARLV